MTDPGDDRWDHSDLDQDLRLLAARIEPLMPVTSVEEVIARGRRRRTRHRAVAVVAAVVTVLLIALSTRYLTGLPQHEAPAVRPRPVRPAEPWSPRPWPPVRPKGSPTASPPSRHTASPRPATSGSGGDAWGAGTPPAGMRGAPLTPAGLRLTSVNEQDGEELALTFDTGGAGSGALTAYRRQLTRDGWQTGAHRAVKNGATIQYDVEDGGLAVFTPQVHVPDLVFQRSTVKDGRTLYYFDARGHTNAVAVFRTQLKNLGFTVTNLGSIEEATSGSTVLDYGLATPTTMAVTVKKFG